MQYTTALYDATQDMASLAPKTTGVANTIFVSPRGRARHAARIKIAVNPAKSFDPTGETASMAIHNGAVEGELPTRIAEQAQFFIKLNRHALLDYWNHKIDTAALLRRLKPIKD